MFRAYKWKTSLFQIKFELELLLLHIPTNNVSFKKSIFQVTEVMITL